MGIAHSRGLFEVGVMAESRREGTVLVGSKPTMNYVTACITLFNSGAEEVVIKARGRAISRAVDCVELLRRAFIKDLAIREVEIGTEEMDRPDGQKSNVSLIQIAVAKHPVEGPK